MYTAQVNKISNKSLCRVTLYGIGTFKSVQYWYLQQYMVLVPSEVYSTSNFNSIRYLQHYTVTVPSTI